MDNKHINSVELSISKLYTLKSESFDLYLNGKKVVDRVVDAVFDVQLDIESYKKLRRSDGGAELRFKSFQKLEYAILRLESAVDVGAKKKRIQDDIAAGVKKSKGIARIEQPEVRGPKVIRDLGGLIDTLELLLKNEFEEKAIPIAVIQLSQAMYQLDSLCNIAKKLGDDILKPTNLIKEALTEHKKILLKLYKHEKADVYFRYELCKPMESILIEARKGTSIHFKIAAESVSAMMWIEYSDIWEPINTFDHSWSRAQAHCDTAIQQFKIMDQRHVVWVTRLKELYAALRNILISQYTTLPWTPRLCPSSPPVSSKSAHNEVVWTLNVDTTTKVFCFLKDTKTVFRLAASCKKLQSFTSRPEIFKHIRLQIPEHRLINEVIEGLIRLAGNGLESFCLEVLPYPWESRNIRPTWFPEVFDPAVLKGIAIWLSTTANLTTLKLVRGPWAMGAILAIVSLKLPRLEHLILTGSGKDGDFLTVDVAKDISQNCPSIVTLKLSNINIEEHSIQILEKGLKQLKEKLWH